MKMKALLKLSAAIDRFNEFVQAWIRWLILIAVLVSAGNAVVRKAFQTSSNAFLEIQWYLFSAVFLLCAGYALQRNAHVRVDFVWSRMAPRTRSIIEIAGILLFAVRLCGLLIYLSMPLVLDAWRSGETSPNAGGLTRWPVYALVPLGAALLLLQGLSEVIKHWAFLRGLRSTAPWQDVEKVEDAGAAGPIPS
jgi:TRAP-type mannitol/chloroaromatic compound transport system permease small subunit